MWPQKNDTQAQLKAGERKCLFLQLLESINKVRSNRGGEEITDFF